MKRILAFGLLIVLFVSMVGCRRQEKAKEDIFRLVNENYDRILQACQEKDVEMLCDIEGIQEIAIEDGYVLAYCQGEGIAPSSRDYGFYYSEENRPIAVSYSLEIECGTKDLIPEGDGYQYYDAGLNGYYTEQIKDNLYFYSVAT